MYIEVIHDEDGNIMACYCADTLPCASCEPLFTVQGGVPAGCAQARINLDTLTGMEIDAASGQRAVINPDTGQPEIVSIDRTRHLMEAYQVDISAEVDPAGAALPQGMKMRTLLRR